MRGDELSHIAEEQAALRRIAMLVIRGAPPAEVFTAVAGEIGTIAGADHTLICRFHADNTMLVVASWGRLNDLDRAPAVGSSWPLDPDSVGGAVARTGHPVRRCYENAHTGIALWARTHGCMSGVGCPIMVEGRLWGVMTILTQSLEPQPEGVEERVRQFIELVSAAIANAESRDELAASRARVVAAADATRRRIERNLHDGVQQRLVACQLGLRAAQADIPPGAENLRRQMSDAEESLEGAVEELREISRGLHPTILSRGGIGPALTLLARRSAVPVELELRVARRVAEAVEVALYYVVSEALTNAAKHARASHVHVELNLGGTLAYAAVQDDGVGGADYGRGTGLIGLKDRIESLGGRIEVASPIGSGTTLFVHIPIDGNEPSRPGS
jgi:signal transduction histidine kinase